VIASLLSDIRTALRVILKAPAFSAVAILTVAVAIGANTALFSVVNGVLLEPLPYPEPDRLVTVAAGTLPQAAGDGAAPFSDRGYWHFVENNRSFEQFGGSSQGQAQWPLNGEGPPLQVDVGRMTASAFELLGTQPQRGRLPTAEEDIPGGPQLVLLSDALWRGVFGSDPEIVGRSIQLNGTPWEVIGVMPAGYDYPTPEVDVWVLYQLDPASENFGGHHIGGIARLAPGATIESATTDAESLIARFDEVGYGPTWFEGIFSGEAEVSTLKEELVGDARRPLLILLGTMGFVLLIACSNVANLFLVRAESRTRETAVRVALGSGRRRLIQFVLTESVLIGLIAGLVGIVLAYLGTRLLVAMGPASIPRIGEIGIDGSVLAFTAFISVAAGLLFGLVPALRTGSPRMLESLRGGGQSGAGGRERVRIRNILVVTEVALALVLFVGSALMVRSFAELRSVHPGFDAEGVLTFRLSPAPTRYEDAEAVARFYDQLLDNLRALPGVSSAGAITNLPMTGGGPILTTQIDDFPTPEDEFPPTFLIRRATPGYFETMGVPLVEGRLFTTDDHDRRLGSLIISRSIKDEFWPNTSALGKRMQTAGAPARVVGVVDDIHDTGLDIPAEQFVYKPMLDSIGGGVRPMTVTVRTEIDPLSLTAQVRGVIEAMDPELPITELQTMSSVVGDSMSRTSFTMTLLALSAAIALFLGAVGIYGVVSYGVSQRTAEIGVRQAIGADAGTIRKLVLRNGMLLAASGIGFGLIAAVAMGRLISSLLYAISPYDVVALVGGSAVFLAVAALASAIPAERASRIPPAMALRGD
jgi:putative ABC transport system permease protein